jgi:hypothetical protein
MAVQTISRDEILSRLAALERKVARLQARLDRLAPSPAPDALGEEDLTPLDDPAAEREQIIAWLRKLGVISEPSPHTREWAAKWEALSEEEKRAHREMMDSLRLDPPLSQVVLDNRR